MAPTAYVQELSKLTSTSDLMSSIALVYFSPTGNTKKAVSSIGELPCVTVKTFDITGNVEVPETDLSGLILSFSGRRFMQDESQPAA